jgi:glycosyltransferase involved in cell wall biosynthesis
MAAGPVRVLLLIDNLGRAGAERQAELLALSVPRTRVEIEVGCFAAPAEATAALAAHGVPLTILSNRPRRLWPLFLVPRLAAVARRRRIEVIQGFLPTFDVLAPMIGRLAPGVRVSVSRRNVDDQLPPGMLRNVRFAGRFARAIVANSQAVAESVRRLEGDPGVKLRVIPNGIELPAQVTPEERESARRALGLEPNEIAIIYLSHFRDGKGHRYLPEFARRIAGDLPEARILLAGDTESNRAYRRNAADFVSAIADAGVAERFRFLGNVDETRALLAAADVSLNLSDVEGMSNSLMESMALGLPVVATDAGGAREMIADDIEGAVVARGDIAAAASRLAAIGRDAGARRRMGEAARARIARDFSVERMAASYAGLFEELAGR